MFQDRVDAGARLAERLRARYAERPGERPSLVLALPRGGVPVGAAVARELGIGLDVLVIRKVGVPWQPELALGAVGERGTAVLNEDVAARSGLAAERVAALVAAARAAALRLGRDLRGDVGAGAVGSAGLPALVVDDGVATGATARAAARVLRADGAVSVVLAVPVCAASVLAELRRDFDDIVAVEVPRRFGSVSQWYRRFGQVTTDEVRALLADGRACGG